MKTIDEFAKQFTDEKISYIKIKDELFTPCENLPEEEIIYCSKRLGMMTRNKFRPSIALIDLIASKTARKAVVNDKSAWLFICKKNILKEGIIRKAVDEGLVIVVNKENEVLGYGKITGAGITNLLDRGDFLRRE